LTSLSLVAGFAYERELASPDGRDHALVFRATIDGREIQGCDFLRRDAEGRVTELTVMVRPLPAAIALRERASHRCGRAPS